MKKLDSGVIAPKKRLVKIISALAIATVSQVSMAQLVNDKANQPIDEMDKVLVYNKSNVIPGQYIVVFKEAAVERKVESLISSSRNQISRQDAKERVIRDMSIDMATRAGGSIERTYTAALDGFVLKSSAKKAVSALANDPNIKFIEADQTVSINATQNNATWGLDRIDQVNLPLNNRYNYDQDGTGVTAYIVDTGIRTSHSNFGGRASAGFTSINDGQGSNDCNGHGTHVAGTVGSNTYGVAKNVDLVAVRVLGCNGSGSNSGVIAGIDWVTANHVKPAVANMSLGGGASSATDSAVNRAVAAGITMVVAAGNDNSNACNFSPARAANAITVGSTTNTDARSSFSNFGTCLDIFGPGSSITSTWSTSNSATRTISGTSMAAPHVAGVAALYLDDNGNASPSQVQNAIENAAAVGKVSNARTGSPNLLVTNLFGGGNPPPPPPPPSGNFFENTNNVTISSGAPSTVNSVINVPRTGNSGSITIRADIKHTWRGDLQVRIIAPNGASGTVHARTNSNDSGDNLLLNRTFNAGSIQSNGTWRLEVRDFANQDGGFIDSWSITFN